MYKQLTAAALLAALGSSALAQDGALLDLLVKKKVISAQEAEDVRADLVKEQAATSAGKIAIGSWVKEMKIGGDLRLRYQYDSRDFQVDPPEVGSHSAGSPHDKDRSPSGAQNSRFRFRLRLYDEFKLADNWFGGVALATTPAADGANQTFGSGFGKYGIYISKAYLGWHATDWATVIAGKQANPFYTTDLVWDPDINPDGLVTTFNLSKFFAGLPQSGFAKDGLSKDGLSKDGKAVVVPKPEESPWELALNFGAFIMADNAENGGTGEPGLRDNDFSTDSYLFQGQLVGSYKFDKKVKLTIAPGVMFFNAARFAPGTAVNENQFSDVPVASVANKGLGDIDEEPAVKGSSHLSYLGETRHEVILLAPGDVSFKIGSIPAKVYWDFAYNTQGAARSEEIYKIVYADSDPTKAPISKHNAEDDVAWLAGVKVGDNKKKGDLSLNVNWRQTGITSVDPNINDSDFALGELNTRGLKTELTYNLTDFATFGVSYFYAWNLRDEFSGGAAASVPATATPFGTTVGKGIGDGNNIQVLFVDLVVKF